MVYETEVLSILLGLSGKHQNKNLRNFDLQSDPGSLLNLIFLDCPRSDELLPLNGGQAEKSWLDSRYRCGTFRGQIMTLENRT